MILEDIEKLIERIPLEEWKVRNGCICFGEGIGSIKFVNENLMYLYVDKDMKSKCSFNKVKGFEIYFKLYDYLENKAIEELKNKIKFVFAEGNPYR